eukprot:14511927-Alexandrium_andersonii.AAC.1
MRFVPRRTRGSLTVVGGIGQGCGDMGALELAPAVDGGSSLASGGVCGAPAFSAPPICSIT